MPSRCTAPIDAVNAKAYRLPVSNATQRLTNYSSVWSHHDVEADECQASVQHFAALEVAGHAHRGQDCTPLPTFTTTHKNVVDVNNLKVKARTLTHNSGLVHAGSRCQHPVKCNHMAHGVPPNNDALQSQVAVSYCPLPLLPFRLVSKPHANTTEPLLLSPSWKPQTPLCSSLWSQGGWPDLFTT